MIETSEQYRNAKAELQRLEDWLNRLQQEY
jgi:hypothetical protein